MKVGGNENNEIRWVCEPGRRSRIAKRRKLESDEGKLMSAGLARVGGADLIETLETQRQDWGERAAILHCNRD